MMTAIIVVLLLLILAFVWAHYRAQRKHTTALRVLEIVFTGLESKIKALEAKIDGGTIQK